MTSIEILCRWMGHSQRQAVKSGLRGEERTFFASKLGELAETVSTMPKTYEQDGKGDQAVAYLHYFAGGQANWWITEKDAGSPDDGINGNPANSQQQAFGLADLFGDGGELGYISIAELIANGAELDFHFTPKTLAELRKRAA